jgi:N-acetylglutamate synthase-like GNAT family acetyltransferase
VIRRYNVADQTQVRALHELALRSVDSLIEGPDAVALDRDLEDIGANYIEAGGDFFVDDEEGQIVAMGGLRPDGGTSAEVKRMRVHPDWQRRGRGRAMLHILEQRAHELGFRTLVLDTTEEQVAAQSLFATSGYAETSRADLYGRRFIFMRKVL